MAMSSRIAAGAFRRLGTGNGALFPVPTFRSMSSLAVPEGKVEEKEKVSTKVEEKAVVASYWGVKPPKIAKEDGTVWPWKSFRPWETYEADLSINLKKHHVPTSIGDKMAFWTVKALRLPTDIFFQNDTLGCKKDGLLIGSC